MKKVSFLMASILILSAVMTSCANDSASSDNQGADKNSSNGGSETADAVSETEKLLPDVPEDLNFEGHVFTIINNEHGVTIWTQRDIYAEEILGEPINDAVFKRNSAIQEKYNCEIQSLRVQGAAGQLQTLVTSGDSSVDLATLYLRDFASLAQSNYLVELKSVSSMDFTKPWYDPNSVKDLSIVNKLFGVASDMTITDKEATTAIVFNKQLYEDHGFLNSDGDIYTAVKDGKWDFNMMKKMVVSISSDLDGNSVRDENDLFGILYQRDSLTSFLNGSGINIATKDSEDIPHITFMNENGVNTLDMIFDLLYQRENCLHVMEYFGESGNAWSDGMTKMFSESKALFMWIRMADVEKLREMELDFGIVPIPKHDSETQQEYYSSVNPYVGTVVSIPKSVYDTELTGYLIEVLSAESMYELLPEYYEKNLQGKISRDEESREMLDIIFNSRIYDIGQIYDMGNFANTLIYMTMTYERDVVSRYAKSEKMIDKTLEKLINSMNKTTD